MIITIPKNLTWKSLKTKLILFLIFIISLLLRTYHFDWDQAYQLHPDERQITMVAQKILFPQNFSFSDFLEPTSTLNPHFFAYGSLPIYLLKFTGYVFSYFDPQLSNYGKINLLGRLLSALFDACTVLIIFKITKLLFNSKKKGLIASLVYALSVFPIQLSHFYAVDTLLTFFVTYTLYRSIILYRHLSFKNALFVGLGFGLSLATKVSATVLVVSFCFSLLVETLLSLKKEIFSEEISFFKKFSKYAVSIIKPKFWIKNKIFKLKKVIVLSLAMVVATVITFIVFEPFSIIDFPNFWQQIQAQGMMTKDAFIFPYTLQYVGTMPYLYQLKNIFLWGLGPAFGMLAFIGFIYTIYNLVRGLFTPGNEKSEGAQLIIFSFSLVYFLVVGHFAVKFMRYCLPIYPILAILIANIIYSSKKIIGVVFLLANLVWLMAFLHIYNVPNTRITATQWINQNVFSGSTILRESWDDGLPLGYANNLKLVDMSIYDSDYNYSKWPLINQQLQNGDYLVLASNRLYTPLQKLTDCDKLPLGRCYEKTAKYYQDLFAGKLGYTKVAEFTDYPSLFGFSINDQSADESFTVYDHPKVMIFKNQK